jgi:hypothetical protein
VDDSSDCTIVEIFNTTTNTIVHFDCCLVGSVSTVSENTRFRQQRRAICDKQPSSKQSSKQITYVNESHPFLSHHPSLLTTSDEPLPTLPIINEANENNNEDSSNVPIDPLQATLHELNLDPTSLSSSYPSPTQIKEIANAVIGHLQKHGCITMKLINFIKYGYANPTNSSSTTPEKHPTLLSSDKMSDPAPLHCWFIIQQLSRYFGFCSFKNWDTLHDVCQPNFSFIRPTDSPLELGQVINIKKACSNKTPIDYPKDFLEIVHCNIGHEDTKSAGNCASYCMLFVDHATRYSWLHPLKSYHRESIKDVFSTWTFDIGSFPKCLHTDFDRKILDGPTGLTYGQTM